MQATHSMMVASIVAVMGLAVCGTGSASPTVAKLATAATTTTAAAAAPSAGSPAGSSGGNIGFAISGGGGGAADLTKMEAYAKCMRSHGVADFPDPTPSAGGGGQIQIRGGPGTGTGIDPNSAAFQAAQNVCKSLLPNGGVAPAMSAAQQQAFLDFAACMRSHGVPSFPDPQFSGGGVRINGGGVDPNSPAFQAAQTACKAKLPGGFAGKGG